MYVSVCACVCVHVCVHSIVKQLSILHVYFYVSCDLVSGTVNGILGAVSCHHTKVK